MMNTVFLLLGSNQGDRVMYFKKAKLMLREHDIKLLSESAIYETEPWGNSEQPQFLNQVIQANTTLDPMELLQVILNIEKRIGRIRTVKNAARVIDIDILFYNDRIIAEPGLHIPHPHIQDRRFVLVPMNELAPDFLHPSLKKNMAALLESCPDQLEVKKSPAQ